MNRFLLDISVQELPYQFIPSTINYLETSFAKLLNENNANYSKLNVYGSPRHLVVDVIGIEKDSKDQIVEAKGPILNIAKDSNGNYTQAALGFAKKNGVETSDLFEKDGYIFAKIVKKSKTIEEILEENVKKIIMSIQGSHFMRWEDKTEKFSRPVEHVLALYNDKVLENIELFDIKASRETSGHRFSKTPVLEIKSIETYLDEMKKAYVFIDQNERKELIKKLSDKKANEHNLTIKYDDLDDLMEEITFITEYPNPVVCEFEKEYLDVPDIVTTTVMTKHQRYIPLYEKSGKLSNKFIAVSNYVKDTDFENIINGNQRVVKARLEDGLFFFREDTKEPLEAKLAKLSGITFQKNLGNLKDKTERLTKLSEYLSEKLNISDNNKKNVLRCATLAKADLATSLVFEFTELQGYIGEVYAKKSQEIDSVACGIKEHYFPLTSEGDLAETIEGQIVGLADKIDTLCAVFLGTQGELKKKRPTGSNDPLGVRRATVGILRTIIEKNLNINVIELIKKSTEIISKNFDIAINDETQNEIEAFVLGRYSAILSNKFAKDVIESKISSALYNLNSFEKELEYIEEIKKSPNFPSIQDNFTRIARLLKGKDIDLEPNSKYFEQKEEENLLDEINKVDVSKISDLEKLSALIEEFFNKVLVMADDENVKNNRLALINKANEKISSVCNFEKLI